MASRFANAVTVAALVLACCMLPSALALPSNSLAGRPSGKNGYFVCLPGVGFCCAAKVSGFLFPSYVNSTCISMQYCNLDGSFNAIAPGLWQDSDCTKRVTAPSEVPNCTGYIQTTQVNLVQNYIRIDAGASLTRPQLLQLLSLLVAALAVMLVQL